MQIILIRHGKTSGNMKKQYIGRTDQPLCEAGRSELMGKTGLTADQVLVSPMKRCLETAAILFPHQIPVIEKDFRECDFGLFEEKSYEQLKDQPSYRRWLESGGKLPFPQGESASAFKLRCQQAFIKTVTAYKDFEKLAFVVHGGTIMAILEAYGYPHQNFYDYQAANGCGYTGKYDFEKQQIQCIKPLV